MTISATALTLNRGTVTVSGAGGYYTTAGQTTPSSMNYLVLPCIYKNDGTTNIFGSISDNKGNTFTQLIAVNTGNGGKTLGFFGCKNAVGGAGHTFTCTYSTATSSSGAAFLPFYMTSTGIGVSFDQEVTGMSGFQSAPYASGNITTTIASAMMIFGMFNANNALTTTFTLTNSFTLLTDQPDQTSGFPDSGGYGGMVANRYVTSTGTYSSTVDDGNGANDVASMLLSFTEDAAPPPAAYYLGCDEYF